MLILAEVLQIVIEVQRERVDLNPLHNFDKNFVGEFLDVFDKLSAERRVKLQRKLEEFKLWNNFWLFKEEFQLIKVKFYG